MGRACVVLVEPRGGVAYGHVGMGLYVPTRLLDTCSTSHQYVALLEEESPQPHSQIAALQIHHELAMAAQCTTKALKVHMVNDLQRGPNGAGQ